MPFLNVHKIDVFLPISKGTIVPRQHLVPSDKIQYALHKHLAKQLSDVRLK